MSASADSLVGTSVYVITDDPYTVLKVEQALRILGPDRVRQLRPRDLAHIRAEHRALFDARLDARQTACEKSIYFVPTDLLAQVELTGAVIIGYGPAEVLDLGIDELCADFVAVPWTDPELRYRVRRAGAGRSLACGDGVISWGWNWVAAVGTDGAVRHVSLSPTESAILNVLARATGETVPREVLGDVLGADTTGESRALDMRISRLRARLREVTEGWEHSPSVVSHRGRGYQFTCP